MVSLSPYHLYALSKVEGEIKGAYTVLHTHCSSLGVYRHRERREWLRKRRYCTKASQNLSGQGMVMWEGTSVAKRPQEKLGRRLAFIGVSMGQEVNGWAG